MRCEHFPIFTRGILRAQSECLALRHVLLAVPFYEPLFQSFYYFSICEIILFSVFLQKYCSMLSAETFTKWNI